MEIVLCGLLVRVEDKIEWQTRVQSLGAVGQVEWETKGKFARYRGYLCSSSGE